MCLSPRSRLAVTVGTASQLCLVGDSPRERPLLAYGRSTHCCLQSQNFQAQKSKDSPLLNSINSPVFGFRSSHFRSHKSNGGNAYARKPNWSNPEASSLKCLCPARETARELVIPGPCRSEQRPRSNRDLDLRPKCLTWSVVVGWRCLQRAPVLCFKR